MDNCASCVNEQVIRDLFSEGKFEDLLKLLKVPENKNVVKSNSFDFIRAVCSTLKSNDLPNDLADVSVCQDTLTFLANEGNPKEVLVALLEQADSFKSDEFFCLLLKPLQLTLQKVPGKRGKSLQWVLSTLNAHLESLPLPPDSDFQGDELLLLDLEPAVQRVCYVTDNYLSFIEVFVDEVSFNAVDKKKFIYSDRISNQRDVLQKYILKLFDRPFLYQDLCVGASKRPKSKVRSLCEKAFKSLSKISKNFFNMYKFLVTSTEQTNSDDVLANDSNVSKLALSNFVYVMFSENIELFTYPLVYSNTHIFFTNLTFALELLSKKENIVTFKGLSLSKVLLSRLSEFDLCYSCLEMEDITTFPKVLLNIAVYCSIEESRNLAVKLFLSYVNKFDWEGRYHQIMHIVSTAEHSGSQGLVINLYKTFLHENLMSNASTNFFTGKNLNLFLHKTFVLPDAAETDILENCDKIITSLNLLRYLLIKDKKEVNMTGVWHALTNIESKFLIPLQTGIDMSRAHYKLKLNEVKQPKNKKKTFDSVFSMKDDIPSDIPFDIQEGILNRALVTFDMLESVLARVREILQNS